MSTQIVSLQQMEDTVRRMTARYTQQQMTSTQIHNYINLYYTLYFPEEFKNLKLTKPYIINTVPNVDTYDFIYEAGIATDPAGNPIPGNVQIAPPVYCQGYILRYYQDKTTFFNRWPKLSVNQQIGTGDGTSGPYSGIIPPFPFLRAQMSLSGPGTPFPTPGPANVTNPAVIISAIVNNPNSANSGFNLALTDVPQPNSNVGLLYDNTNVQVGTVNYLTGAYTFTLQASSTIPSDATIYASVIPYMASRPTDILFYNQQIILRPVPLQVYQIEFNISQQPTQLIAANAAPELDEWYLLICAGAAKLIYTDFPDPDGLDYLMPIWQEQLQLAQRRTLKQLGTQRAATIFSQPGRPLASWFWGTEYSGS